MIILVIFILFVGGGWLIGKLIGNLLFPKSNDELFYKSNLNSHQTNIYNQTIENHLHITKDELRSLLK